MPKPPKCTIEQLQAELIQVEAAGFMCSAFHLRLEIERRLKSSQNKGRPATNDTPRHKQWREASAKRRTKADKEANAVIAKTVEKLSKGKKPATDDLSQYARDKAHWRYVDRSDYAGGREKFYQNNKNPKLKIDCPADYEEPV